MYTGDRFNVWDVEWDARWRVGEALRPVVIGAAPAVCAGVTAGAGAIVWAGVVSGELR